MRVINLIACYAVMLLFLLFFACNTQRTDDMGTANNGQAMNGNNRNNNDAQGSDGIFMSAQSDVEEFAKKVAEASRAEIQLAQLAQNKSADAKVTEMAKTIESDHNQSLNDLHRIVQEKGIALPEQPDDKANNQLDKLTNTSDMKEFNKEWTKELIQQHEKSIREFENFIENTEDIEMRSWAIQTLPHLRSHLENLEGVQEDLGTS